MTDSMGGKTSGAVAGPETAAEHLKNALQLLMVPVIRIVNLHLKELELPIEGEVTIYFSETVDAVRARLARALAALEGTSS